jgi:cob(I)alamin adenosyltransferase
MSIITKTGDDGTTGLMYNRRVSKCDPRVEAYGAVDELNAALGMARAATDEDFIASNLLGIQKNLVVLMGELATAREDLGRYAADGFQIVTKKLTARVEEVAKEIEAQNITYRGWATPGSNAASAALDLARTICRRAERRVCELVEPGHISNSEISVYLNRLSDLLWLMARWNETKRIC